MRQVHLLLPSQPAGEGRGDHIQKTAGRYFSSSSLLLCNSPLSPLTVQSAGTWRLEGVERSEGCNGVNTDIGFGFESLCANEGPLFTHPYSHSS